MIQSSELLRAEHDPLQGTVAAFKAAQSKVCGTSYEASRTAPKVEAKFRL